MSAGALSPRQAESPADYPLLSMHIDGAWVGRGQRAVHRVINPATGEEIGHLPLATAADLDEALHASARAFETWRHASAAQRAGVMKGAAALLRERCDYIARIATMEEGKTLADAAMEVRAAAALFEFYGEEVRRVYGRVLVRPAGERSLVIKQPVGPVAAFAPWNFPVNNPARKLAAPIAAGCSVILKPAEEAPGAAIEVLRALIDAGLPSGVAQIVFGKPDEVSRHLLASPVIKKVSFTGSTSVGKHLARLAADNLQRTTMELGGHAPVLVFADADLGKTVETLLRSKYRNAGQVCVSPTRFYVEEPIYDAFVARFADAAKNLKVGDGQAPATQMGPVANRRRLEAMETLIDDARKHGGTIKTGGRRSGGNGFYWEPTVLSDTPNTAQIMNEEPFGPVAILNPFRTQADAICEANRLPYGLAAYLFTSSLRIANEVGDALEAGMVGINTASMAAADAPFGGVKHSGWGAEDGPEGLEACLVTKTIHQT